MGSFGENLKREREVRGVTLQEISEATKIGTRALQAIEEERFEQLPGGIFNKGFVRAYTRFLGMDEEQAVLSYEEASGQKSEPTPYSHPENADFDPNLKSLRPSVGLWIVRIVVVLLLLAAASYIGWKQYQNWSAQRAAALAESQKNEYQPAPAPQTPAPAAAPSTLTPAVDPDADEASKGSDPINLSIVAKERTWVSVTTDSGLPKTTMLDPDDAENNKLVTHAQKRVVLVVGNAGGVEIGFNGKKQGVMGESGKRKQVIYLPDGPAQLTPSANAPDKPVAKRPNKAASQSAQE